MRNWKNPDYLRVGNPRQQQAYASLQHVGVLGLLHAYDPVLAGTIPLAIDVASSDLDILCAVAPAETSRFIDLLQTHYAHLPEFALAQKVINHRASVVCRFHCEEFEVEVFGQDCPTEGQQAFRHMVVEERVLEAGGDAWRTAVRRLKEKGLKTEPAFATLLQLSGDPYEALLTLEGKSVAELRTWLATLTPPVEPR